VSAVNGTRFRFSVATKSSFVSVLPHLGHRAEKILNFGDRFCFMGNMRSGLTTNIGHPKLFSRGRAEGLESSAKETVNNFVAARVAGDFGWPRAFIWSYPLLGFPAPAGQAC